MELKMTENLPIDPSFLQVLNILLIIAVAYALATVVRIVLERLSNRFAARRLFFKRLQPFFQISGYAMAAYFIIRIISPNKESLLAMLYAMGFAIGLAAQDLLKDLIGGIVVLVDASFQVGDRIRVGDFYGEVTKIGLRSTKLETLAHEAVTIPNSTLLQADIANVSDGLVESGVTMHIYVPSHADLDIIETMVREAVLTSKLTYTKKPITISVKDTVQEGETMSDLEIRAYVYDARYAEMFVTDITRRVKKVIYQQSLFDTDANAANTPMDSVLADTLMAMGARFARHQPVASQHNGH